MNSPILKGILLASLCSLVSLLIHLVISFFRKGRDRTAPLISELGKQVKLLLAVWLSSFLLYSMLFFLRLDKMDILFNSLSGMGDEIGFIYGITLYLILAFIYLTIYYFVDRSVSATILEIIDCSSGKSLTADEIKKLYNVERKYQIELQGMLEGRFIIKEGDYYRNSLKGKLYARIARFTKALLKLGPGG